MDFIGFFIYVGTFCVLFCVAYNTMIIGRELRRIGKRLSEIAKHLEQNGEENEN